MKWYQHPYEAAAEGVGPRLRTGLLIGLAVTLIVGLAVLPPYQLPIDQHLLTALLYGGITLVTAGLLSLVLPPARTLGRQLFNIGINFFLIGLANYLIAVAIENTGWAWQNLVLFQGITLLVGALPVALLTLYGYNKQLRRRLREANQLNSQSSDTGVVSELGPPRTIKLPSGFALIADDLLAAEANKNYVGFYARGKEGAFLKHQERITMKAVAELLRNEATLLRVHRAFLVNLSAVTHVSGNAQGFRLRVPPLDFEVPVSRSYVPEFRAAYAKH